MVVFYSMKDVLRNFRDKIFEKEKKRKPGEEIDSWQVFAREQFLKLREKGIAIPVVTL